MAINSQKVLVGGLAAGIVLGGLDFLTNGVLFAEQNRAAMDALNPSLAANMEGAGTMAGAVILDLVFGIILVWTYAAMRPRFGAGPKTAAIAGCQVWVVAMVMYTFMTLVGMYTWSYFALGAVVGLVTVLVATEVGAMIYKEE